MKKNLLPLFLFLTLAPALVRAQSAGDEMFSTVRDLEVLPRVSRAAYIKDHLKALGVGYVAAPFKKITVVQRKDTTGVRDTIVITGENIIARFGGGAKRIIIGAHYDSDEHSPGANDNASGVAVALELIQRMRSAGWNYSIDVCFFDREEEGLLGSMNYITQFAVGKKHLAMINLDVEGTGSEVFVGPVGSNSRFLMRYVHEAAKETGYDVQQSTDYPMSDYMPFAANHLESISISVVPKGDSEKLARFVQNGYKADSGDVPQVLGVMHTPFDRSTLVTTAALNMSYTFTRTLLLLLNDSGR